MTFGGSLFFSPDTVSSMSWTVLSMSVPNSNCSWIDASPSTDCELMSRSPLVPSMPSSIGSVTWELTASGDAPG